MKKATAPLHRYLDDCRRRGLAATTLWSKGHVLRKFDAEVGLMRATKAQLSDWLDRELSMSSKATYLATLRSFYEWCVDDGVLDTNPARRVSRLKVPRRDPAPIDADELTTAIHHAEPMMRAWLLLAAAAGLRCCEIASLRAEDIHLDDPPWLHVESGKGAKDRNVPLHPGVASALLGIKMPAKGRLWLHDAASVSKTMNRYLKSQGTKSTAHKLRAYAATMYWKALNDAGTPDILLLTDFLGHSSPSVSLLYTRRDQSKGMKAMEFFEIGA